MKIRWGVEGIDGRHFDENGNLKTYEVDIPDDDLDDLDEEEKRQAITEAVEENQQYVLSWWWEKVE